MPWPNEGGRSIPGYYDLGGKILPGGNLKVSNSNTGQPRSMSGIDVPEGDTGGTYSNLPGSVGSTANPGGIYLGGFNQKDFQFLTSGDDGEVYAPGGKGWNVPLNDQFDLPSANDRFWMENNVSPEEADGWNALAPSSIAPAKAPLADLVPRTPAGGMLPGGMPSKEWGGTGFGSFAQAQNNFIPGLIAWNGPGQANPTGGEPLGDSVMARRGNRSTGALATKFGMNGSAGKWRGKQA